MVLCDNENKHKVRETFAKHYLRKEILFEIVKFCKGRETAFLGDSNVRCVMAHKVSYLTKNFSAFKFYPEGTKIYNLYISVGKIRGMKMFSFYPKERKAQRAVFNAEFNSMCEGYDLVFDFDAKECQQCGFSPMASNFSTTFLCPNCCAKEDIADVFERAKKDCLVLKGILDRYKVPYFLKCSGSGFHVRILFDIASHGFDKSSFDVIAYSDFCKALAKTIKIIFNLKTLDDNIYDTRRLWKLPYSLDIKTGNVALPLTDEEFLNFKKGYVNPNSEDYLCKTLSDVKHISEYFRLGDKKGFNKFYKDIMVG